MTLAEAGACSWNCPALSVVVPAAVPGNGDTYTGKGLVVGGISYFAGNWFGIAPWLRHK